MYQVKKKWTLKLMHEYELERQEMTGSVNEVCLTKMPSFQRAVL